MSTSKLSLTFRIFRGDQLVREERLAQGVIKVGKVASAHLRIDDESVSRMHAIVEVSGDEVHLIDLGSTRGTFVNGQKIHKARLHTGDTVLLGDSRVEVAIEPTDAVLPVGAPMLRPVSGTISSPPATPPAPPAPPSAPRTAASAPRTAASAPRTTPPELPAIPAISAIPAIPHLAAPAAADDLGSAKAIEVAAMLGDSVVGVKHCMDPRGGKITAATWALGVGGLACLLAAATAFTASVAVASQNRTALERHTRELHKPAYSFRPHRLGIGADIAAVGGLALGIGLAAGALARARRERRSPSYRIGTAPGVELAIEQSPSPSFPLVAPSGDDFVFNLGAGIEGELIAGGTSTPLSELAATGRTRPSTTVPGAIEIPIPAHAKIRARAGQATFLVSAVARPKQQPVSMLAALESSTLKYVAGSLAAHLGIVLLLWQVDIVDAGINANLGNKEALYTLARLGATEAPPPPPPEEGEKGSDSEGESRETVGMELPGGEAGDPDRTEKGALRMKDRQTAPQMSREEAVREAERAGVLGSALLRDSVSSMAASGDFTSGFDENDQWGAIDGSGGAGRGTFGMSVHGPGPGGNCLAPPCGIIGTGKHYTGLIGTGPKAGDGWGPGRSSGDKMRPRVAMIPIPQPRSVSDGTIDKSIIRRKVKEHQQQISYCYQKELLARPDLDGEVMVQFLIAPTGNVQTSVGSGFDTTVASCVANVIASIAFPASKNGSPVTVNYPFNFRRAG